jgi:serine/threonine protein kinase
MGTVHRGRHQETGQIVAVKVLAAETASDPMLLRRFEQECTAASQLRHPHIVRGLDFGVEEGRPYLVMEFVQGQNLRQRVRQGGPLPVAEGIRLLVQIADALQLAHEAKLIHRDVTPDNILLRVDGQAKLTDLGLLKDLNAGGDVTRSRTSLGTVAFMAPEQFTDAKRVDLRCDVYGLAATLYFALTGLAPFQGRGNLTLLKKKLKNDFVPPRHLVPSLSAQADEVIRMALDSSLVRRPGSCKEFADLLTRAIAEPPAAGPCQPKSVNVSGHTRAPAPAPERRAARRYPSALDASCRPLLSGQKWSADVEDISVTGIRLQVDRRFEPGAVLNVEMFVEASNATWSRLVWVRWVREVASRRWSLGCAFKRHLTEGELHSFLDNRASTIVVQPRA